MKLVNRHIDKYGVGHVTLRPEDDEDMWHLYNLIQVGDSIRAPAVRRVQNVSSTGSTESHRIRLNLTIQVGRVDFSSSAAPSGSAVESPTEQSGSSAPPTSAALHIAGRVTSENPHVKLGAFHTLDIEANRDVRIEKLDGWDSVAIARVDEAIIPGRGAEVGAVVCGEGTAAFCLLSQHMTLVANRINVPIPRKSAASGASQYEKGMAKFYATLYESFIRHIPYGTAGLRAIVIASPGWVRDGVLTYLLEEAGRRGDKTLQRALKEKAVKLTGIAAILTFPLDVEVVEAEEREAKEEEERAKEEQGQ
ncbi:hypothetical protein C0992_007799 [Termitomyces sp. T32_za158]|nr:hypothetical protein C0992_007799 [Termitomyces sp. T32_za158]